ncbi:AAA family ATPase, partial [Clostridium sp. CMCC3676]
GAINQKVKTYSLGMRQRLGVAQALIHSPALLILDEPTNGLDPQGMAEFRTLIRDLATNGTSVLISSHLLSEIQ